MQIVDVENGSRFETYTIAGAPGSGMVCLNGAAARQVQVGDHVIKEMDYLLRMKEEREDERFKKLDEAIRNSQKTRKQLALFSRKEEKKKPGLFGLKKRQTV